MQILDSGERREFESGAVRDVQEGKGRCDLLPLVECALFLNDPIFLHIYKFKKENSLEPLVDLLENFAKISKKDKYEMILEVAKHFEDGCNKYGERNWEKGIPIHCYIDSAIRHYLKYKSGWEDEPHDRAFVWNIMCCMWTLINKPELNDFTNKEQTVITQ